MKWVYRRARNLRFLLGPEIVRVGVLGDELLHAVERERADLPYKLA